MKRYLLATLLLFHLFPAGLSAQKEQGVIRYLVTHNWVKKMAAVDYISKERKERMNYTYGKRAEWKLYSLLYFNGQKTKYEDSEEKADVEYEGFSWRKDEFYIYRDFEKNSIFDIIKFLGKAYVIEDTITRPHWKMLNDMKEVAGHICMNATYTDSVKGQIIMAWFALDMPLSSGPERFCGLPGMILEVNINDGAMLISADNIDPICPEGVTDPPSKVKGKRISEADYLTKIKKQIEDRRASEDPWFWGVRY